MRILHVPTYSFSVNPLADSGYICFRNLIRATPWTHHYVVVPDWDRSMDDDLDDLRNVTKVPARMHTLYRIQESFPDPDWMLRFSPAQGARPVEAVINASPARTVQLASGYATRLETHERPVIVNWDLLARDDLKRGWQADDRELQAVYAGVAMADLNLYGSPMMQWMTERMVKGMLAPAQVRRVLETGETIYAGVPVERIDEHSDVPKRERFSVFYGGRMGAVKRIDDLSEVIDSAYRFGRDIDYVVCTGSMPFWKKDQFVRKYPEVELHIGTNQEETWREMGGCHAAIGYSRHEMIGSMFIEEIAAGLPVVLKRHRWNESLLPDDYPLWVDDKPQMHAKLRMLYEDWKEDPDAYAAKWTADNPWTQHIRTRYDSEEQSRQFIDRVMREVASRRSVAWEAFGRGRARSLVELSEKSLEDGITWTEYIERLKKEAQRGSFFVGRKLDYGKSNASIVAYRCALWLGWFDDVTSEEPRFYR